MATANRGLPLPSSTQILHNAGDEGDDDDGDDDQLQVLLDERLVAEEIARIEERGDPEKASREVVEHEVGVVHPSHACHERSKGADNGDEAGEDDGLSTILLIELMCLVEIALLEDFGVRVAEELLAEEVPDGVVARVAQHGGGKEHECQQVHAQRHVRLGGNGSADEEEGVSREERGDHESGLAEDDEEQDGVGPLMVVAHHLDHVLVDVEEEVDDKFHRVV